MSFIGGFGLATTPNGNADSSQLQSTISAATSGIGELPPGVLHHPITCTEGLGFDSEGVFSCAHFKVPADDPRTHACLVHSLAILIIELGITGEGMLNLLRRDPMEDPLVQRANEKKIYEEVVNVIVDMASSHFPNDGAARLRIYEQVAENFAGMVRSLRKPEEKVEVLEEIQNG